MVLDTDSYLAPITQRLESGSRASETAYTDNVMKHKIKEFIPINRSLNDAHCHIAIYCECREDTIVNTPLKGSSRRSLSSLICPAIFPNECTAIFAGFVEDHQLIGGVCVEDMLKPLLSCFIVMLCCSMVHNFACEAKVM